ncbi:GAF domain-containing protein [Gryllotalpicola kribbensis]|uniref:GAF domain-containing protein n=1 Tax=Gryllotalpicola kribbensis TaxID=993084 RepID=A0ABP8ATI1_9MICO
MVVGTSVEARLRALIQANEQLVSALDLEVVLRRIVELAIELSGAQYGALGVLSATAPTTPSGKRLERFIYVGLDPDQARAIGHLPEGHGLLGALIDSPEPIRIDEIGADIRSVGFPAHHPPMHEFLGVPVHSRDTIFGNLYLTNHEGGFTADDQEIVTALAATAGLAIENARLFTETARRQAWTAVTAEITAALLAGDEHDPLALIAERVHEIADAAVALVLVPATGEQADARKPDTLRVAAVSGLGWEEALGDEATVADSLAGRAFLSGQPEFADRMPAVYAHDGMLGPTLALPLTAEGSSSGVLLIGRSRDQVAFSPATRQMASEFAAQASLALALAQARDARQRMALVRDRGRIARELHDNVIQQLFGSGLELQGLLGTGIGEDASASIMRVTDQLDDAISQIRLAIFAMTATQTDASSLRHRVIDVVEQFRHELLRSPRIDFRGALDSSVTAELADDVVAVVREAVANTVKHAHAKTVNVSLALAEGRLRVEVADDGRGGVDESTRRSGLANLRARADARGGTLSIDSTRSGTRLTWEVPVSP